MCLPPDYRNFKIGYKNIQGLHRSNECKIAEYSKECFNDTVILTETWGCDCVKEFDDYDLLVEIKPEKHQGVKKGRKSGGVIVLGKKYLKKFVKQKITANLVWLEVSKDVIKNTNKNLLLLPVTFATHQNIMVQMFSKILLSKSRGCVTKLPSDCHRGF